MDNLVDAGRPDGSTGRLSETPLSSPGTLVSSVTGDETTGSVMAASTISAQHDAMVVDTVIFIVSFGTVSQTHCLNASLAK